MGDNAIYLRAYVEADDATANGISSQLLELLNRHGEIVRCAKPKQYWKIKEYWEVFVELRPSRPVRDAFDQILTELGTGWEPHRFPRGGSWAVWNPETESTFVVSEVRWANVECLQLEQKE